MATPWLTVIVPAYNEQDAIEASVLALRDALDPYGGEYEIIVVDNASDDATVSRLQPLLDGDRIRLIRNDRNRGKGYSMRTGMLSARGELRLHCDTDCYTSLPSLPRLLELLEQGADLAVGSRLAPGAQIGRRQSLPRRMAGRGFVGLCRLILREPTRDLYCGFKLWRAQAAQDVFALVELDGWTFDAEALAVARVRGWRVRETGILWTDREGSRLVMHRVLAPVLSELLRARRRVSRLHRHQPPAPETTPQASFPGGP